MKNKKILIALLLLAPFGTLLAQVHNQGTLYVGDSGELYTNGLYDFGTGVAKTQTTRTVNNGLVSLSAAAVNASVMSTNFVDGFVQIIPDGPSAFYKSPVGFDTFNGPIGFFATNLEPIVTAYFRGNAETIGTSLAPEVENISAEEYWKTTSDNNGTITLYWNSDSGIASILAGKSVDYLTILGYNGSQWVAINSQLEAGSTSAPALGSMTTTENISFSDFTHFAIGARKDLVCYSPISYSGDANIKTWDGSNWTPSAPVINDGIIINGPLTISSDLECYSVDINANVTMEAGKKLTVVNGFTGTGKIVMSNLASVIQQNPLATAPTIEMTRITEQMRRYDYVFVSNPINDVSSFFSQLLNPNNSAVDAQYGEKPKSAFEQLRTFNEAGLVATDATVANTPAGRGLSATVRNQLPYNSSMAPTAWYAEKHTIHTKIEGQTNNGKFSMTLPEQNGWMRLGNPYPSPIHAMKFWELADGLVDKTMYYWTYNTARGTLAANTYNNADFATYNLSGGVAAGTGGSIPDGYILPMQSVLIKSIAPSAVITIDNCVRLIDAALPKQANTASSNGKFKLNLQGSEDSFSQILIAYDADNGTIGYDNGYDSARLSGLTSELSSLIGTKRYTIQTRPAFTTEDVIPLQLDKRTDETFTISLDSKEGVFASTAVLLHDKTLGIYHDLTINGYSFVQNLELDAERFDIVFQNTALNTTTFNTKNTVAFIAKDQFYVQSNNTIAEISIYDLAGRLIVAYTSINEQGFTSIFDKTPGVYIAKIKLVDGAIVNQKLIKQ